jgi:flagellar FliL protein
VKAIAVVAAVVVVEMVLVYMYLPSAEELNARAAAAVPTEPEPPLDEEEEDDATELIEVDLGQFHLVETHQTTNTTLRIDFQLAATILASEEEAARLALEAKQNRIRDQVLGTVRLSDATDFGDPGLGLIRRRILETTNKTLGKPYLQAIYLPDFSAVEQ